MSHKISSRNVLMKKLSKEKIQNGNAFPCPFSVVPDQYGSFNKGDVQINITANDSSKISEETFKWMTDLTEANMADHYRKSSWGWSRHEKEQEFRHKTARFLFAQDKRHAGQFVGFVHYRFEFDDDKMMAVIYCYELQLIPSFQRQELGSFLMDILYLIGSHFGMHKVSLTCLKGNKSAFNFYTKKHGFSIDHHSPSKFNQKADYEILSRKL